MNEPATVATDYLLAGLSGFVAWRLLSTAAPSLPARLWAAGFAVLAVAAVAGGTWHAIHPGELPAVRHQLWTVTYLSIGLADLLMLAGTARAALERGLFALAAAALLGKFLAYAWAILAYRDFKHVGYEYAATLLLLFGLALWRRAEPAAAWLLAGVLVSFAGGLVQALKLAPHRHFNHNDLFHVIQMGGVWLFFRAAQLLRDR